MVIRKEDIEKFRQIWREEFNEEISEDAAGARIGELDALYLFLARHSRHKYQPRNLER